MNCLFIICDNCRHPLVIPNEVEISILPFTKSILCKYCYHENMELQELKQYAKSSREYA